MASGITTLSGGLEFEHHTVDLLGYITALKAA
jgi:hypothetical protein